MVSQQNERSVIALCLLQTAASSAIQWSWRMASGGKGIINASIFLLMPIVQPCGIFCMSNRFKVKYFGWV